jgi:probable HAF family extracellular repeat protein
VIWDKGRPTNLGNLGGSKMTIPFAINNPGQVVGISNLTGDVFFHGFLWRNGVITDLGVLPGDLYSFAYGLNNLGQVVGQSCGDAFCSSHPKAFLWQNGVMTDLNTLVKPGSTTLYLVFGNDINSRGEIIGQAFDPGAPGGGQFRAVLLIPCDAGHANNAGCAGGSQGATVASAQNGRAWLPSPSPLGVRALLQQSLSGRFGAGLMSRP